MHMNSSHLPKSISYESIINYALYKQSSFSGKAYHCFKAMLSKKTFESGLIKVLEGKQVEQLYVVRGRVLHSMSFNESPLTPWVIVREDKVLCAHCDCVAGLGEVCSHVGAILYALVYLNHSDAIQSEAPLAVTSMEQQWGRPRKNITANLQQPLIHIEYGYMRHSVDASYGEVPSMSTGEIRNMCEELLQQGYSCVTMQALCNTSSKCHRCQDSTLDRFYDSTRLLLNNLKKEEHMNKPIERLRYEALRWNGTRLANGSVTNGSFLELAE
ncbi:uncharacterized protein LOC134209796 [Armigeres subalbatus]|uniref:uncharacterized protein LOC134209796 n=1 Tax=Armigeres subalbatus TaxID=124917 RepID=UPI002ED19DAE